MKPSVARIVHYHSSDLEPRPMIIGHVHSDEIVSGVVFSPFAGAAYPSAAVRRTSVPYSEEPKAGHWRWPPRV